MFKWYGLKGEGHQNLLVLLSFASVYRLNSWQRYQAHYAFSVCNSNKLTSTLTLKLAYQSVFLRIRTLYLYDSRGAGGKVSKKSLDRIDELKILMFKLEKILISCGNEKERLELLEEVFSLFREDTLFVEKLNKLDFILQEENQLALMMKSIRRKEYEVLNKYINWGFNINLNPLKIDNSKFHGYRPLSLLDEIADEIHCANLHADYEALDSIYDLFKEHGAHFAEDRPKDDNEN